MASGDPVVQVLDVMPLAANFATPDVIQGGSSPAELVNVWDFDHTAVEYLDLKCALRGYDGGGLALVLPWTADVTTGNVRWGVAIRRLQADAEDIGVPHTYEFNKVTASPAGTAGELAYTTIAFTEGSDMDGWSDGELAIVRIQRDAADTLDGMDGNDAELWGLFGTEV